MSDSLDKMGTDSYPDVKAEVKYEDDFCPVPPESEQVDNFLQTDIPIDIKYEFPEPPTPKKKRRGRPPSKKVGPVPATASGSVPLSKPCTVGSVVGEEVSREDVVPPNIEANNLIPPNPESESAPQSSNKKRRRERSQSVTAATVSSLPLIDKEEVKEDALINNEADNRIQSCAVPTPLSAKPLSSENMKLNVVDTFPEVEAKIQNEEENGETSATASITVKEIKKVDVRGRAPINNEADDSTLLNHERGEMAYKMILDLTESLKNSEEVTKKKLSDLEATTDNLKASLEAQKIKIIELEQKVNEVSVERDTLKESLMQISEKLRKLDQDVGGNMTEQSFSQVISEFDDPMEGSSSTQNVNQHENYKADNEPVPLSETSAEQSEPMLGGTNSTCEQELRLHFPTYPSTSFVSDTYKFGMKYDQFRESLDSPGNYLVRDVIVLKTGRAIKRFLDDNQNLPPEINPFPTNSLELLLFDKFLSLEFQKETGLKKTQTSPQLTTFYTSWLANVQKLFEKFGHHIHTLQIKRSHSSIDFGNDRCFETSFGDILHFLRNLKEFEIMAECWAAADCYCMSNFPIAPDLELPLEYFGFSSCQNSISTSMLNRYGNQLRRVVMGEDFINYLMSQPLVQLQQLQELTMFRSNVHSISNLKLCTFPNLSKLALKSSTASYSHRELFELLINFPKLNYFEMELRDGVKHHRACKGWKFGKDIRGLEYFVYPYFQAWSYNFLCKFPDLKQIRFVKGDKWEAVKDGKSGIFPNLHENIDSVKMCGSGIWIALPKLEIVSIQCGRDLAILRRCLMSECTNEPCTSRGKIKTVAGREVGCVEVEEGEDMYTCRLCPGEEFTNSEKDEHRAMHGKVTKKSKKSKNSKKLKRLG